MRFYLQVPRAVYDEMIEHALAERPNECVGLLAGGPNGLVERRYPLVNALASPQRFESEGRSLFEAERQRRAEGLTLLAIYHSHPSSPPVPSSIDLDPDVNYWLGVEVMSLIISLEGDEPQIRSYWLRTGGYEVAEWKLL